MASRNHVKGQRKSHQTFSSALSSAAAEWLLILLIYLYGLFSFLVTKFAHYSKLQIPCLLCSRLDNILGCERPGFYKNLICHAHKLEISSLAYCHVHQKLADVCEMCETCLLSFATEKKSNSETYRSLVGKLERNLVNGGSVHLTLPAAVDIDGVEVKFQGEDVVDVPLLEKDHVLNSPRIRYCSCCNELFHRKSHVQRLLQTRSIEYDDTLLGQAGHDCLHRQDRLNKKQEKSVLSPSASQIGNRGFDRLSHIGYTELKITSDSESEVPFSDDDDGNVPVGTNHLKDDFLSRSLKPEPAKSDPKILPKSLSENTMPEKLIHATPTLPEPSNLVTPEQLHVAEHHDDNDSSMPEVTITHDLGDLNWNEFGRKDHPSTTSNLTSQNTEIYEAEVSSPAHCTATAQGSDNHPAPAKDNLEISNSKSGEMGTGDAGLVSSTTYVEAPKDLISTRKELKQMQTTHKLRSLVINHVDLNDAYKLAIGYRMNQPSPRDCSRSHEDLKLFLSQTSAGRGLEFLYNDVIPSPKVHGQVDDSKVSDTSSTVSQQSLNKKFSTERNESGFESLDGSIISEIEGESLIDHLKQQIEVDRKSMSLLYKELEEERSASAIAANQAMAMITRLQEEKAAMQMEALQYQRMMEEQAEYDQEALQQTNDLLTEKEKEIQDLEAEIESYKKRLGEESFPTKMKGDSEEREDNLVGAPLAQRSEGNKILKQKDTVFLDAEEGKEVILKDSLLDFEDETFYISECLKRLEKKLHLFSHNGVYVDISGLHVRKSFLPDNEPENGSFTGEVAPNVAVQDHEVAQDDSQLGENASLKKNESSFAREDSHLNGALTVKESHNYSVSLPNFDNESKESYMISRTTDLTATENEVLHLSERLEALEADRNFLEHSINSLRNGKDGVQFIQEIASHLQELRRVGARKREQIDV